MSKQDNYDHLVDRNEIAYLLGVGPTAVSNYVARTNEKHEPFPEPEVSRAFGRFRLWDIADVEEWHRSTFPKRSGVWDEDVAKLLSEYRATLEG